MGKGFSGDLDRSNTRKTKQTELVGAGLGTSGKMAPRPTVTPAKKAMGPQWVKERIETVMVKALFWTRNCSCRMRGFI